MLAKTLRLYHTLKYLKPVQIYGRVWFRLYRPRPGLSPRPELRQLEGEWQASVEKPSSLLEPWRFSFLNHVHDCCFPEAWNGSSLEKLWLYNLHYFDYLQSLGAYQKQDLHAGLIKKWIGENPPGLGNGWEPYPSSLRIVNWIKWHLANSLLSENALQSLAVQVRYLCKRLEYHLLGNHLFANGKALVFAGLFFEGAEADAWLKKGMRILSREVDEQILADGGHFELSPMYHAIILEDMLDLVNICTVYQHAIPTSWPRKIEAMLAWLQAMVHPDGQISLFNDAALGIAAEPESLRRYARRLGFSGSGEQAESAGVTHLDQSGYVRCRGDNVVLLMDVGEIGPQYLPGHAHADTLTFEMSLFGERFVVDSGTSRYGGSRERLRQRQTASHNTVVIDGFDSSEVWGGFRVARRAHPVDLVVESDENLCRVVCSHDGFARQHGRAVHTREWRVAGSSAVINDTLRGAFATAYARLYFHPEITVRLVSDFEVEAILSQGQTVRVVVDGGRAELRDSTYHPEFGKDVPNRCLHVEFTNNKCSTTIMW